MSDTIHYNLSYSKLTKTFVYCNIGVIIGIMLLSIRSKWFKFGDIPMIFLITNAVLIYKFLRTPQLICINLSTEDIVLQYFHKLINKKIVLKKNDIFFEKKIEIGYRGIKVTTNSIVILSLNKLEIDIDTLLWEEDTIIEIEQQFPAGSDSSYF